MERDRDRMDATIVSESCLVRGRRSGSRPPMPSHGVGGLWGGCVRPASVSRAEHDALKTEVAELLRIVQELRADEK